MADPARRGMIQGKNNRLNQYAVAVLLICCAGGLAAQQALAPRVDREARVAQARAGDPKTALAALRSMVEKYPGDARLLADTVIVANWAGDDAFADELFSRADTPKNDAGVTEAAARSSRNLHEYDKALDLYRSAATLAPDRWQPLLGQAMVQTDKGDFSQAAEKMQSLLRDHLDEADVESGEAYLCSREGDYACVIDMDQRLIEHRPADSAVVQCDLAQALSHIGGNTLAAETCMESETHNERYLLEARAAELVRWTESSYGKWTERRAEGEEAVKQLDRVIAESPIHDDIWRAAELDRLLALYDLRRMHEVIDAYAALRAQKIEVPAYALVAVAGADLTLHHPGEAEALYRSLVAQTPENAEMWGELAYAQLEGERTSDSFNTVDDAYKNAPSMLQLEGQRSALYNDEHAGLGVQMAQMRGYAGMPSQEYAQMVPMLAAAPANQNLNRAVAMNDLARGWPTEALRQERIANSYSQPDILPVLEDAEVLDAAGKRDEADAILPALLMRDGNTPAFERFAANRVIEHGWQANAEAGFEWSKGQYIGTQQHSDGDFYSPLFNNRWRAYLHALGDTGSFQEGSAYRLRSAMGVSYDYRRESVWVEFGGDNGTTGAIAAGAMGADLNYRDRWSLKIEGDSDNVTDVQLIAELGNVRARSVSADLAWRQSELSDVHAGFERLLFTDGNQRTEITGKWDQRVFTSPRVQVTVSPELWNSRNSEDANRIYFNPKVDFSFGPSTSIQWRTWRRYDRSFRQDFAVYLAPYWQSGYGVNGAYSLSYEQHWQVNKRFSAFDKVTWNSQPYSGSSEPYTNLVFGVKWGLQ